MLTANTSQVRDMNMRYVRSNCLLRTRQESKVKMKSIRTLNHTLSTCDAANHKFSVCLFVLVNNLMLMVDYVDKSCLWKYQEIMKPQKINWHHSMLESSNQKHIYLVFMVWYIWCFLNAHVFINLKEFKLVNAGNSSLPARRQLHIAVFRVTHYLCVCLTHNTQESTIMKNQIN